MCVCVSIEGNHDLKGLVAGDFIGRIAPCPVHDHPVRYLCQALQAGKSHSAFAWMKPQTNTYTRTHCPWNNSVSVGLITRGVEADVLGRFCTSEPHCGEAFERFSNKSDLVASDTVVGRVGRGRGHCGQSSSAVLRSRVKLGDDSNGEWWAFGTYGGFDRGGCNRLNGFN